MWQRIEVDAPSSDSSSEGQAKNKITISLTPKLPTEVFDSSQKEKPKSGQETPKTADSNEFMGVNFVEFLQAIGSLRMHEQSDSD